MIGTPSEEGEELNPSLAGSAADKPVSVDFRLSMHGPSSGLAGAAKTAPVRSPTPAGATVIVAALSLIGTAIGSGFGYFIARDEQLTEQETRLQQILTEAQTKLREIETEAETQTSLQAERLSHDHQMAERRLASDIILATLGKGDVSEQIVNLRAYATAGLLGESVGKKILALPDEELPVLTPERLPYGAPLAAFSVGPENPRDSFEFSISDGWLFDGGEPVPFSNSPNKSGVFSENELRFVVIDHTANSRIRGTAGWYSQPLAKSSAHIIIGRWGEIVQGVSFNEKAWHAGKSEWKDVTGLNSYAIGVKLVNLGLLRRSGSDWTAWNGEKVDDDDIGLVESEATQPQAWQKYTDVQRRTLESVLAAILRAYPSIEEVVRYSQIAPGRKIGPGPLLEVEAIAGQAYKIADDAAGDTR